jgi:putative transposase
MWNLGPPTGFQGLREDIPLQFYFRQLPHWRQDGATYFVTFRLADSLPKSKRDELAAIKSDWELHHPPPRSRQALEQFARDQFVRVENFLDQGYGQCVLKNSELSELIASSMHHFEGDRYELGCYVVMPNHVHAVVRPTKPKDHPVEEIARSWKSYSGREINLILGDFGAFWQEECFDRIIQDAEHLWRTIQYIGRNPKKARLSPENRLWIRPEWGSLGWTFAE